MRIAKLVVSYDRGLERNDEKDLRTDDAIKGVLSKGEKTADGKVIRGLGTHFKSERDQTLVKARAQVASQVRQTFREKFVATSIDGCYVLNAAGDGKKFLDNLPTELATRIAEYDVEVRVQEFDLVTEGLDTGELRAWSDRIKNQLASVQLGRKKEIDEEGLNALVSLTSCPLISAATATRVRELVEAVREQKITRLELRRSLTSLDVEIDEGPVVGPRRPHLAGVR